MMDYRIEKRPAFQVAEKIKMVPIAEQKRQNMIPDFWTQSQKDGTLRHLCDISGGTLLGICYGNPPQDAEEFAYAIGAVHDKGQAIPDDLQISEIPAHTWAKFCGKGAMPQAIQQLWHRIYTEFFPASEYEPVGDIDLEVYPDGDMDSPDYESEIWIPVRKKQGNGSVGKKKDDLNRSYKNRSAKADLFLYEMPNE
ncbi:MAG: GyrI-like domain-containing protein [Oscillospiraceae bacterium]